jgi:hypothetical protein
VFYYKVYSGVEFFIFAKMVVNLEGGPCWRGISSSKASFPKQSEGSISSAEVCVGISDEKEQDSR